MAKKYILSETQVKRLLDKIVEEQKQILSEQEPEVRKMMGIQTFLNYVYPKLKLQIDGAPGPKTVQAIKTYQQQLGLIPDGVWGPQTEAAIKKNPSTWKLYVQCIKGKQGPIDKLFGPKL